ncbi:MAG: hypothetical protein WCB27_02815 [Thermoguttaceae bacterium]|jgi:predicted RNase H-like HicB family nuclease
MLAVSKACPAFFSQGESLAQLEENIRDAYRMMIEEEGPPPCENAHTKEIEVLV